MNGFIKEDLFSLETNVFHLISKQWMLITAGNPTSFNTMTANWGGLGYIWNKPVAFVFIRPQRYTFEFTEKETTMTLSFFEETYRNALNICGKKSGRDTDKIKESGLTPMETPSQNMAFHEALYILECQKLYAERLNTDNFIDFGLVEKFYPQNDTHKMYIAEIEQIWKRIDSLSPSLL